ncbi:lysophospholipid acyltransferase family protein [Streptomyces buecherae]|uniref:lysophospholipid acyltransferase family protein n=1 Tax=Streptomyces buecherae TaxID=2763006 RepID=UPI001C2695E4|nr:lysophospholipid acyltransferase family protein [Streptomyces buecherae]
MTGGQDSGPGNRAARWLGGAARGSGGSLRHDLALVRQGRDWRGRARPPRGLPAEQEAARAPFRTAWARSAPAALARDALRTGVLKPLLWAHARPVVTGREHLAGLRGPVVFVANHASHLDTPLILGALPGPVAARTTVGAAADHFFASRLTGVTTALLFNAFPVDRRGDRETGRRGHGAGLATRLIDSGWSVLLFPEGSRSRDGWMGWFRLGAARLCLDAGVPAVPVAVRGTFAALPPGDALPRRDPAPISVRFGRPVVARPDETAPAFRDRMMREVNALWAESDVGWYGALRGAVEAADTPPTPAAAPPADGVRRAARWRRVWESTRPTERPGRRRVWGGPAPTWSRQRGAGSGAADGARGGARRS